MSKKPEPPSRQLCPTHPDVNYKTAWGCPECVREMRSELVQLKAELKSAQSALRVIYTWATFHEGAELNPEDTEKLCRKTLAKITSPS